MSWIDNMIAGAGSELKLASEIIVENREWFTSIEYNEAKTFLTQKKIDRIEAFKGTVKLEIIPTIDRKSTAYRSYYILKAKMKAKQQLESNKIFSRRNKAA